MLPLSPFPPHLGKSLKKEKKKQKKSCRGFDDSVAVQERRGRSRQNETREWKESDVVCTWRSLLCSLFFAHERTLSRFFSDYQVGISACSTILPAEANTAN